MVGWLLTKRVSALLATQHQADGDNHGGHHHRQVINHADGGDHRVE